MPLLEEHDVIGTPVHCTGVLGLDAFDELSLSRGAIVGTADAARFVSPNGTTVLAVGADQVRAAVVGDRAIFDGIGRLGHRRCMYVETGVRVAGVWKGEGLLTVQTSGAAAPLEARAVILACGASYGFQPRTRARRSARARA